MIIKSLAQATYKVVGVVEGGVCLPEKFLSEGDESTLASRNGLMRMIVEIAARGLSSLPHGWVHLANQEEQIYELRKGRLRLFFFKGSNGHIAVLTIGVMKKQQKADKASVSKAIELKKKYETGMKSGLIEVLNT